MKFIGSIAWLVFALPGGCGAYADIAGGERPAQLVVDPPYIFQGQRNIFTLRLQPAPPWSSSDSGMAYLVRFDIAGGDVNLESVTYDGDSVVQAVLLASATAAVGERRVEVVTGYERLGRQQQQYRGQGLLWVLPQADKAAALAGGGD